MTLRPIAIASLLALAACGPTKSPVGTDAGPKIRGLLADPARLPFTCVTPGCDVTLTTHVRVMGDRRLAIKRIILQNDTTGEFEIAPSQPPPFIVGSSDATFSVDVHYAPKGAPSSKAVNLAITYTDASPVESEDRVPPGELVVPLVRRLVGEPVLVARPTSLSFGAVANGQTKTLPVRITNEGFGNVALEIGAVDAGNPAFRAQLPAVNALVADSGTDLPVTFAPTTSAYVRSVVTIFPTSSELDPVQVSVEGTSLSSPHLNTDPAGDIDFGEVPRRQSKTMVPNLMNQGGRDLVLSNLVLTDPSGNLAVSLPNNVTTVTLAPLSRLPLTVKLDAGVAGPIDATVALDTNEAGRLTVQLKVVGTVTEPKLQLTPSRLDWGTVPQGWVVTKPIELRNVGYGALTIKNILLVAGSSNLFTLKNLPTLPLELQENQRIALDVEFRAETSASFQGALSVESTDPDNPFSEAALVAVAGSCTAGCPITNGTPSCQNGVCAVGSCNTSWFDVDGSPTNGCECHEVGTDPGTFCADGLNLGNFRDSDGRRDNRTGIIPTATDIDIIKFHAEDASQFLSDDFNVQIRLDSNDPGISMCVYHHNTGSALTECYMENESCGRSYRQDGHLGSSDDADFTIKVFRAPGSTPTCTTYTVFMQNG